jgi:hypothetical protein
MVQHIQTKIYDSHATNMNPNPKNTQGKPHEPCHKQLAKTQTCVLESQIIFMLWDHTTWDYISYQIS